MWREDEEGYAAPRVGECGGASPGRGEYDVKNNAVVVGVGAVPVGVPRRSADVNLHVPPVEHTADANQRVSKIGSAVRIDMAGKTDRNACAV